MIDSWMALNKNISDLIFGPSMIVIPKPLFYQDLFCHLIHLFADFSGGLTGQSRVTELHIVVTDKNCRQTLFSKLTQISGFLHDYVELQKFGVRNIIPMM